MNHDAMNNTAMNNTNMSASDKKFVRGAAEGGLAEVELGKLATEKAASEDVKKFGQRMVDDHSKANDELKQVASSQGIDLPDHVSAKDKALKERLSKLSGASFDKAYMASMVKDHKADIADFEKESDNGKDTAVKQFATSTLPTLKDHLAEAERIEPTVTSTRAAK
jgi:putative membrane protein